MQSVSKACKQGRVVTMAPSEKESKQMLQDCWEASFFPCIRSTCVRQKHGHMEQPGSSRATRTISWCMCIGRQLSSSGVIGLL